MKRTTVQLEVEIEGPTASGDQLVNWLLNSEPDWDYYEDRFRVVNTQILSEER